MLWMVGSQREQDCWFTIENMNERQDVDSVIRFKSVFWVGFVPTSMYVKCILHNPR